MGSACLLLPRQQSPAAGDHCRRGPASHQHSCYSTASTPRFSCRVGLNLELAYLFFQFSNNFVLVLTSGVNTLAIPALRGFPCFCPELPKQKSTHAHCTMTLTVLTSCCTPTAYQMRAVVHLCLRILTKYLQPLSQPDSALRKTTQ